MRHENVCLLPIKIAEVDENIVPVVGWLNTFENVCTIASCEGDDEEYTAYVMFECNTIKNLTEIQQILNEGFYHIIQTYVHYHCGKLRFTIRFQNEGVLKMFCKFLFNNEGIEVREWD